ncbi:MAG: methyltransferase domain-containing protein [Oligoflexia bacterium]|nr:methyltransferase domain-containing protein [Oligoflexia bacterium]
MPRADITLYLKLLKKFGKKIIFEFDDLIEQTVLPQTKYFKLLEISDGIIVGNNYLKQMASRYCNPDKITVINTTISFDEYESAYQKTKTIKEQNKVVSIVWIGSSTTMAYLEKVLNYFEKLETKNKYKLVIISNSPPHNFTENPTLNIEFIKWNVSTYLYHLAKCDIGIMPLFDDDWARAKCGFKLIQYFGVGIPVVTSPLGINVEIVDHEVNGFFAFGEKEWRRCLETLIDSKELQLKMGLEGQKKVQLKFDNKKIYKTIICFYQDIMGLWPDNYLLEDKFAKVLPIKKYFDDTDSKKLISKTTKYIDQNIIVCPNCEGDLLYLSFKDSDNDKNEKSEKNETEISTKNCKCSTCSKEFPFINSILRFVPSENYANSFGLQWNYHIKTQIDKYSGLSISKDRLVSESKWDLNELNGELVLECGSGAGRFTGPLCESRANVVSFDYSSSVEANYCNNYEFDNLLLLQASIYEMPFKEESFDRLLCLGVIQHTPDVEKSFKTLFKYIKKGGKFCIDVYAAPYSYFHPRHIMRPFTKRMKPEKLYQFVRWYVPKLFPVSTFLHKVPMIGQYLARIVPVANWRSNLKLKDENMWLEWAILDTFDWLSPTYEYPQTATKLRKWCKELNLSHWELSRERGLYIIRGIR